MKLAAQMYTVRRFCQNEADIEKSVRRVKEMGYNAIQISGFGEYRVQWLADLLKELDMEAVTPHVPFDRIVDDTDAVIAEMKILGCSAVGLGQMPLKEYKRGPITELLDKLAPAIEKIHAAGLSFVFHNHWKEFLPTGEDGKNTFDLFIERFPADYTGFIMDFYWVVYACLDPIATIEKYRDRLGELVHFKDMIMNEEGERIYSSLYTGCIDHTAIYNKLKEIGCKWVAVEEDWIPHDGDPFEALEISLRNIKANGLDFENL